MPETGAPSTTRGILERLRARGGAWVEQARTIFWAVKQEFGIDSQGNISMPGECAMPSIVLWALES